MRIKSFVLPILLLIGSVGMANAQNCDQPVVDNVHVLSASQLSRVQQAAQQFENEGGIMRIRIVDTSYKTPNLDAGAQRLLNQCPAWQTGNHKALSNLGLLIVATDGIHGGVGFYFGTGLSKAFSNNWERIKSDYMLPALKNRDFAGGITNTTAHLTARFHESKSEAMTQTTVQHNTVNNQAPTDLTWLKWLVVFLSLGGAVWLLLLAFRNRRKNYEEVVSAQQSAIKTRSRALSLLSTVKDRIETATATGERVSPMAQSYYDSASIALSGLTGSISSDPTSDGMTAGQYDAIRTSYSDIIDALNSALSYLSGRTNSTITASAEIPNIAGMPATAAPASSSSPAPNTPTPAPTASSSPSTYSGSGHGHHRRHHFDEPAPQQQSNTNVVVVNNTPIFDEPVYREPVYHHHTEESDSGSSFSGGSGSSFSSSNDSDSDSSFGGGSSSSFSSDDSSSSSSSSSDSDSSWGSSDSGSSFDSGSSSSDF